MDWNAVAALTGMLSAVIAIVSVAVSLRALRLQGEKARLALQTDILFKIEDGFDTPDMRQVRRRAAGKLLANDLSNPDLERVLAWATRVAMLVNMGALDLKLAYTMLEYDIARYWQASHAYVARDRAELKDPAFWSTLEGLAESFRRIRKQQHLPPLTDAEITQYLSHEANLL